MQYGYVGVFREVLSTLPGILVAVDLTIALTMVAVWMWNDARRRGIAVVPYLVVGLLFGSVGPLLYLLRTSGSEAPEMGGAPQLARSR
jgi:fatty acid desaturase